MAKFMNTNTNLYRERIEKFILDHLDFSENSETELSDYQKINAFFEEFKRVADYPYNLRKFPNEQDRIADYLQGVPSNCNFPIYYADIIEATHELHGIDEDEELSEKQIESILDNYYNHLAFHLIRIQLRLERINQYEFDTQMNDVLQNAGIKGEI